MNRGFSLLYRFEKSSFLCVQRSELEHTKAPQVFDILILALSNYFRNDGVLALLEKNLARPNKSASTILESNS